VNDVDRDLRHLFRSGSDGGEGAADVGEHLAGLGSQVTGTDKVARSVYRPPVRRRTPAGCRSRR
jgi:hypothetical protein